MIQISKSLFYNGSITYKTTWASQSLTVISMLALIKMTKEPPQFRMVKLHACAVSSLEGPKYWLL